MLQYNLNGLNSVLVLNLQLLRNTSGAEPGQITSGAEPGQISSGAEPEQVPSRAEPGKITPGAEPGNITSGVEPEQIMLGAEPGQTRSERSPYCILYTHTRSAVAAPDPLQF